MQQTPNQNQTFQRAVSERSTITCQDEKISNQICKSWKQSKASQSTKSSRQRSNLPAEFWKLQQSWHNSQCLIITTNKWQTKINTHMWSKVAWKPVSFLEKDLWWWEGGITSAIKPKVNLFNRPWKHLSW